MKDYFYLFLWEKPGFCLSVRVTCRRSFVAHCWECFYWWAMSTKVFSCFFRSSEYLVHLGSWKTSRLQIFKWCNVCTVVVGIHKFLGRNQQFSESIWETDWISWSKSYLLVKCLSPFPMDITEFNSMVWYKPEKGHSKTGCEERTLAVTLTICDAFWGAPHQMRSFEGHHIKHEGC